MPDNFFDQFDDDITPSGESNFFDQFDEDQLGDTTEEVAEEPSASGLFSMFTDIGDQLSTQKQLTEDSKELALLRQEEGGYGPLRSNLKKYLSLDDATLDVISGVVNGRDAADTVMQVISPEYKKQRMEAESAARAARMAELQERLEGNTAKAESLEAQLGKPVSLVSQALGGLAGDPTQALPTVGALAGSLLGPEGTVAGSAIGSIPISNTAFASAYAEATDMGANEDEALEYANKLTAIQGLTEGLGGAGEALVAKGAAKLGLTKATKKEIEDQLLQRIRTRLSRIAGAGAVEAVENTAQEAAGDIVRATTELSDVEAQERLKERVGQDTADRLGRYLDAAAVGAVAGSAIASPVAVASHSYETSKRQAEIQAAVLEGYNQEQTAAKKRQEEALKADTELNLDIAREQERIRQEKAKEDAFTQAEQERAVAEKAEAQRKADETEAGFRTIDLENQFRGQTRVDRAGDSLLERTPINPPAEITPEQVQAEREQAEAAAAAVTAKKAKPKTAKKKSTKKVAKKAPVVEPATAPAEDITDAQVREMAKRAGITVAEVNPSLNMATEDVSGETTDFPERAKELVKGLVKDNSQPAVDVQNIIRQKKLVIAPNAESIGRNDTGQAAYDIGSGKMYLYTDHVNTKNPAASVIAALHESTHAGQFNDREGRSNVLRQMMGKDKYDKAQQVILQAARDGNVLARRARDKAKAAGDDRYLELVPYFVGEAAKARQGFGRLGGLVKDIKSSGKNFVREKMGVDWEIDLDDIDSAAQTVAGEIARTPIRGQDDTRSLDMIGGERGTGYSEAASNKRTYRGAVDQKNRYEFSDDDSPLLLGETEKEELLEGHPHRLEKVIDHPELFTQYPTLRDLNVIVDLDIGENNAYYDRVTKSIVLSENALDQSDGAIRSLILHEVQHAIQDIEGFVPGANPEAFANPEIKEAYNKAWEDYNAFMDSASEPVFEAVQQMDSDQYESYADGLNDYILSLPGGELSTEVERKAEIDFFLTNGYATTPKTQALARRYTKLKDTFEKATEALQIDTDAAEDWYLRDYGETEARTTQLRRDLTPEQRQLISPEEDMRHAAGKIPVERTLDTRQELRRRNAERAVPAASRSLAMARDGVENTPAFKRWFKNSKVVDEDGKPLVVYHGTTGDFNAFTKLSFGAQHKAEPAFFFSSSPDIASGYALVGQPRPVVQAELYTSASNSPYVGPDSRNKLRTRAAELRQEATQTDNYLYSGAPGDFGGTIGANVMPVYLSLQNPMVHDHKGDQYSSIIFGDLVRSAKQKGHDGVIIRNADDTVHSRFSAVSDIYVVFEPNQIKSAIGNSGEFSPGTPSILNMAQENVTAPAERLSVSERITRIVSEGTRAQTHDVKIAEHLDTRYRRALAKDVTRPNDPKLLAEIEATLTSVDNADPTQKPILWAKFKKKYPNLAPVLLDMRNKIDENSREIVRQILSTGRELTPKETKQVVTLLSQEGKYLTRAYSAFQPRIGKEWADKRWKAFEATRPLTGWRNVLRTALTSGRRMSPTARRHARDVLTGIKWLEAKFSIPDDETLSTSNRATLEEMYEDHIGALSNLSYKRGADEAEARRQAMISALSAQRELLTPEQMREMATQAAKEILGLADRTSNVSRMFSELARDPGTLKERENVPEPLRKLLGEIKDPAGKVLATISTQSALIARANVLTDLIKNYTGELVLPKSRINEPGMRAKFPVPLQGEEFGPLNSFYATREVASRIKDMQDTYYTWQQAIDAMSTSMAPIASKVATATIRKVMAPLTRAEKLVGVVANPINWLTNLAGSPITMLMNGNLSIASANKGRRVAQDYIVGTFYNTTTDMLNDAIRHLNIEAVDVAEMQQVLSSKLKDYLTGNESAGDIMRRLHNGARGTIASYAMMDAWAKVANFHERIALLQRYYKELGDNRSLDEIKREAGDVASYTNLSAERVPKLLRSTESIGVSKFVPYFSETMRIVKTNYNQAFIDLERAVATEKLGTPGAKRAANILRGAANRRFFGNTLATLFLPARFPMMSSAALAAAGLPTLFALVPGFDDDAEEKRRMLGEFNRYQDLAEVGKDKDGNPIYYSLSGKMDPIGPVTDFIRLLVNSDNSEESYSKIVAAFTDLYIVPTYLKRVVAAATRDVVPEARINRIAPEQMETLREWLTDLNVDPTTTNKGAYIMDSFIPGVLKAQDPKYTPKPVGVDTEYVKALQYMGAQFETLNPKATLRNYHREADETMTASRAKFNDAVLNATTMNKSKMLDAVVRYTSAMRQQQSEDQRNVTSLRAWGYSDDDIYDLLTSAGYAKDYANNLVDGINTVQISMRSLEQSVNNKKKGLTQDEIEKYETRVEDVAELLYGMDKQLEAMGVEVNR